MDRLIEDLLNALPTALQSDECRRRALEITDSFEQREESAAEDLGKKAEERGIALLHTPTGYSLAPLRDGHMISPKEFEDLPEDEQARMREAMEQIKEELASALSRIPLWQREMRQRFRELEQEITRITASQLLQELEQRYADLPEVLSYLAAVRDDIIENLELFKPSGETPVDGSDGRFTRYRGISLTPEGNGHQAEFTLDNKFFIGSDEDFGPYRTGDFRITTGTFTGVYSSVSARRGCASYPAGLDLERPNGIWWLRMSRLGTDPVA